MKYILFLSCWLIYVGLIRADAQACDAEKCTIDKNCRCASKDSPIDTAKTPQFVIISIDDAVQKVFYDLYYEQLLKGRKNGDGSPISATFLVPHIYTNYTLVNELYNAGYEIGSNSISKNYLTDYWQKATVDDLSNEMGGQKTILSTFANIPAHDIIGARVPYMKGDDYISALEKNEIQYDNTWATLNDQPFFPYTLDYLSSQQCLVSTCPKEEHKGIWIIPINDLKSLDDTNCNNLVQCNTEGKDTEISGWLRGEFDKRYKGDKQPFNLLINAAWFAGENTQAAIKIFLDDIGKLKDVFVVSNKQLLDWVKDPKPIGEYKPTVTTHKQDCTSVICPLKYGEEETRYMVSCVKCPDVYPWIGNPLGKKESKILNI